jgi:hypothetical protein
MPPTPITPLHRVTFKYTSLLLPHKQQAYCNAVPSGDSTGFDLEGRVALGNVGLSLIADAFFTTWAGAYKSSDSSFEGWELWERIGTNYVFVTGGGTSITPSGGAANSPAMGWCVSGKDVDNKEFPAYMYEGQFGGTQKFLSYPALNAFEKELADYYFAVGRAGTTTDAYNWRMARGAGRSARWLSHVIDSNQKLRRVRHLA